MTRPRVVARTTWRDSWHPGTSSAILSALESGWRLTGRGNLRFAEGPTTFRFRIDCTSAWEPRSAEIVQRAGPELRRIPIEADGQRRWSVGGLRNRGLDGCIDLDLAATPATNTLSLRRLGLAIGETQEIPVAWVLFPDIEINAVRQRYTRLSERRYRYEGLNNGFVAEFEVDENLMVTNYANDWNIVQSPQREQRTRPARRG